MEHQQQDKDTELFVLKMLMSFRACMACETRADIDVALSSETPDWFWEKIDALWQDRGCPLGRALYRRWTALEREIRRGAYAPLLEQDVSPIVPFRGASVETRWLSFERCRLEGEALGLGLPIRGRGGSRLTEAALSLAIEEFRMDRAREELAYLRSVKALASGAAPSRRAPATGAGELEPRRA